MRPQTMAELCQQGQYQSLEQVVAASFASMVPSERLSVTEAAIRYSKVPAGGNFGRSWDLKLTPYLEEPQDVLTSLDKTGMIFIGPARTGKTVMLLNWLGHTVKHDPTDMLFVHMNRDNARKWSTGDLDRFLRLSTKIRAEQLTARKDDNTFDKTFKSGMRFLLTYPTVENLSGITIKYGASIDYDRNEDDVDGEGNLYDLLAKRSTTFKRFAMTAAESSPNPKKEIADPKWTPETPHQAPPIPGIFELYNRGDRRKWHWFCKDCGEGFEGDFKLMKWNPSSDLMEAAESAYMPCPHCGSIHYPHEKEELNNNGMWVPEGFVARDGKLFPHPHVKPVRSNIASFWMLGPAAGYQNWSSLVLEELRALDALARTNDEGPLRKTRTTDQGTYYIPQSRLSDRTPEEMKDKAEFWGSEEETPTVPDGVRFLIGTIDVQARSFVAQVQGVTDTGDLVIIDSFKLRKSERLDEDGDPLPIDPAAFLEDWDVLLDSVLFKTYPLNDGSGRHMRIRAVGCDSGGREGVTTQAYAFWRKLKNTSSGVHRRFILVKGEPKESRPRAMTAWPDSSQKDKYAVARGDVPVVMLQSNMLKDQLSNMIARTTGEGGENLTGGGRLRYPNWMPDWFYRQMTNEVRLEKGWDNPANRRNETWDLAYYAIGLCFRPRERTSPYVHFGIDRIDWSSPPGWAKPWDENDLVFEYEEPDEVIAVAEPDSSQADEGDGFSKTVATTAVKLAKALKQIQKVETPKETMAERIRRLSEDLL